MRQTTLLLFSAIVLLLMTTSSCVDQFAEIGDTNDVRFDAEYALPLIDSKITMADILEDFEEDATLTVDPDGLLRFQYSGDLLTKSSLEVFEAINETIDGLGFIPLTQSRQALPIGNPEGLELDVLQINGTRLSYGLVNRNEFPVTVNLTLPTVIRDGEPFSVTGELPGWDGSGDPPALQNIMDPIDITGYDLTLENDSIYIEFITTDAEGNEYEPGSGSIIRLEDFSFSYAEGYLGNVVYEGGRDTIDIDFFDNWIRGDVYFEDPTVTFNFENSFGVPTEAVINVFNIITADGEILPLESVFIDEGGIEFPFPDLDEVGEVKAAQFVFDTSNSNIAQVLGSQPVAIDYDVNALTNPDGNTDIRGFITDSSFYRVLVDVELPLYGQAANFEVRDTFELNLGDYADIEGIEWKLVTTNGLPLAVEIQGEFLDDGGNNLARLFAEGELPIIGGAPVDADGIPTASNEITTFLDWNAEQVNTVIGARRLVLTAIFSTTRGLEQSVQLLSDQEISVRLGAIVKVSDDR